jgi:hypothetical protein
MGLVGCLGIRLRSGHDGCIVCLETCLYYMGEAGVTIVQDLRIYLKKHSVITSRFSLLLHSVCENRLLAFRTTRKFSSVKKAVSGVAH